VVTEPLATTPSVTTSTVSTVVPGVPVTVIVFGPAVAPTATEPKSLPDAAATRGATKTPIATTAATAAATVKPRPAILMAFDSESVLIRLRKKTADTR